MGDLWHAAWTNFIANHEVVTLAAAVIALLGSLLSLFIGTRLAIKKERRQLLWSKELDRFFELEHLAGELVEEVGSYRPIPEDRASLDARFRTLELAAGRFGRYPAVRQAIRDLHNALGRMFVAKRDHLDDHSIRAELDPIFRKLLAACDTVVGKRRSL
jgi:hypothetical protein